MLVSLRDQPKMRATNSSAGAAASSAGVPSWTMRPSRITPTRSASATASATSCVTSSVGSPNAARCPCSSCRTTIARVRIERRERLVEQQDLRVACERSRERDALALAARELSRARAGEVGDPEPLHQGGGLLLAPELDVLRDREVREQRVVLEDHADRPILGGEIDAAWTSRTRRRRPSATRPRPRSEQARDRAQHGALARSRGAHERDRLGRDGEAQLEAEAAEGNGEFDREDAHATRSLTPRRIVPLNTTSSALMARVTGRSVSNAE